MTDRFPPLKPLLASLLIGLGAPALAQEAGGDGLDDLFDALQQAEGDGAARIVEKISEEWSKSGSPSMDLLLARGRDAMEAQDLPRAVEHFSAAIDHAPDFAEAYHARAIAFYRLGQYGPALEDLRLTLALNPRHFGAMSGLALILEEVGREAEALSVWREVLTLNPSDEQGGAAVARLSRAVEGTTL